MHGRLKVRTTEEQKKAKEIEREKKLKAYKYATEQIFSMRGDNNNDDAILKLTHEVLSQNSDFYSLWNIRKEIFIKLKDEKTDKSKLNDIMTSELYFLEQCLKTNPKSYGAWTHRCFILANMPEPNWEREELLTNKFLEYDDRNFHCWDYRRHLAKVAKLSPESEFDFTTKKINANFSNFSSWHYRSQLLHLVHPGNSGPNSIEEDILNKEFQLAQNAFFTDPNDQTAWFYHRLLLNKGIKKSLVELVYVDRKRHLVFISFSKAISIGPSLVLKMIINDEEVTVNWSSYSKCDFVIKGVMSEDLILPSDVTIKFVVCSYSCNTNCAENRVLEANEEIVCIFSQRDQFVLAFRPNHSIPEKILSSLKQQLIDMFQLHELEPTNKWAMHALITLMQLIDASGYHDNCIKMLQNMKQLDPMRTQYYQDYDCKLNIEHRILASVESSRSIDISNLSIRILPSLHLLTHMRSVNLTTNQIADVSACRHLLSVELLLLRQNQIDSLDAFGSLTMLCVLDLQDNKIESLEKLLVLKTCSKLHTLILSQNPISKVANIENKIKEMLPNVTNVEI